MKLSDFISLLCVLCVSSAPVYSDTGAIDYTLKLIHNPRVQNQAVDSDSLYSLVGVAPITSADSFYQFQLPEPHLGIAYSTSFRFATSPGRLQKFSSGGEAQQDNYHPVSQLYKIGYGEQYNRWYGEINFSVEQFDQGYARQEGDLLSLGFTAGRRIALTGLGSDAPLWLLTLNGEYDQNPIENSSFDQRSNRATWFVTPAVHWSADDFSLSAGVQVPLDLLSGANDEDPSYRLRANFKQRF